MLCMRMICMLGMACDGILVDCLEIIGQLILRAGRAKEQLGSMRED